MIETLGKEICLNFLWKSGRKVMETYCTCIILFTYANTRIYLAIYVLTLVALQILALMNKRKDSGQIAPPPKKSKEEAVENVPIVGSIQRKPVSNKETIRQSISSVPCKELLSMMKGGTPIVIDSTSSIYAALQKLFVNHILSAPVFDSKTKEYVGFVDMVDLVAATVDAAEAAGAYQNVEETDDLNEENLEERLIMDMLEVRSIIDCSKRDPFLFVYEEDSMIKAAELLQHNHRIAILDDQHQLSGILTQSGFVEYLSEEYVLQIQHDKTRISALDLPKEVFSVTLHCRAIDAFKIMKDKKVSGLAVVDTNGILADVISVSDLMLWTEWVAGGEVFQFTNLTSLALSVEEFLHSSRAQKGLPKKSPKVCEKSTMVKDASSDMLVDNIHRLFLVNQKHQPTSVLNFGNIIQHLLSH